MVKSIESNKEVVVGLKKIMEEGEKLSFIVDGSNFLYHNKRNRVNFKRLISLCDYLQCYSDEIFILLPDYFESKYKESNEFQSLKDSGRIFTTPSNVSDDFFIIEFAKKVNGFIISNDGFKEFQDDYPIVIKKMTIPFLIIEKEEAIHIIIPSLSQLSSQEQIPN